jgi:uncharacterized membrane protein
MVQKQNKRILFLCRGALVAALYVALTFLSRLLGLDSGAIQVRFSEMLCILPIFMPSSIFGLTVGCFLSNLLVGAHWLDILIGPLATLIGALGTYLLRRIKWLAPLPAVLSNALIIPFVLSFAYGVEEAIPLLMLTVGIGEVISIYGLGGIFMVSARKFLEKLN